jgi:hypothetical protein
MVHVLMSAVVVVVVVVVVGGGGGNNNNNNKNSKSKIEPNHARAVAVTICQQLHERLSRRQCQKHVLQGACRQRETREYGASCDVRRKQCQGARI